MPTLSKRPPTPPAKRRAASPPKPVAEPQGFFLRFYHSEDLRISLIGRVAKSFGIRSALPRFRIKESDVPRWS